MHTARFTTLHDFDPTLHEPSMKLHYTTWTFSWDVIKPAGKIKGKVFHECQYFRVSLLISDNNGLNLLGRDVLRWLWLNLDRQFVVINVKDILATEKMLKNIFITD